MARKWTEEELSYLLAWGGKASIQEIAKMLHITQTAVGRKARELGIPKLSTSSKREKVVLPEFGTEKASMQGRHGLQDKVRAAIWKTNSYELLDVCRMIGDTDRYTTKQVMAEIERVKNRRRQKRETRLSKAFGI